MPGGGGRRGCAERREAHSWVGTERCKPLREPLSALAFGRSTSEPGRGSLGSARNPGAEVARRGARRSLSREQAPDAHHAPSSGQPSAQCGCRCPHGGHGLARPGTGEDEEEAAAATSTAAARLGPGREPRGRGARARPREHVGPERSAGRVAAGTAALLAPNAEPSR